MRRWQVIKVVGLTAIAALVACSISTGSLDQAEKRIAELKEKGVPDSSLSRAKVFLYQARDARQRGNRGLAQLANDSLRIHIAQAEAIFNANITRLQPVVDSMRSVIKMARADMTGLQQMRIDSMLATVDSLANIKWYLQANGAAKEIIDRLPQFKFDEARSKELRPRIPGEWVCINETKSKENKDIHAIEKKVFYLKKDGTAELVENKKGQSGPYLRENWEFKSWGKYDLLGDTIVLFINRFASVKQDFERLYVEDNGKGGKKKVWKNEPQPTYDSLITDGSQNRFVTFMDLKEDFKQVKKY